MRKETYDLLSTTLICLALLAGSVLFGIVNRRISKLESIVTPAAKEEK